MLTQLFIGSVLTVLTLAIATVSLLALDFVVLRIREWAMRPPHGPRLMLILGITLMWTLLMMTIAVWIWAAAFRALDIFTTLESAAYFALVAFTTLGFGDILLPQEWRLLGGMAATNGLLMFGLLTAILVESLRETRRQQRATRNHPS